MSAALSSGATGGGLPPPPAIVDGDVRLQSTEVADRAGAISAGLAGCGVGPGSTVAFQLPNWWEAVVLFHACWRLGAVAAPLHPRLGVSERTDLLDRLDPAVVLVAHDLDQPAGAIPVRGPADAFRDLAGGTLPPVTGGGDDDAVWLATSGSSGWPKLVRHRRAALAYKARTMVVAHGLGPDDAILMPAPLAHISGLLNGVLLAGHAGMTTVMMDRWDPDAALHLVNAERVSFMIGPPTFFVDLVAARRSPIETLPLRLISSGGASVTASFVRETREHLGAWVKRTYGSTEAPTVTTWQPGDPPERAAETDGRPVAQAEVRVVHAQTGEALPPGATGEVQVRGPELFVGYDDVVATADVVDVDGWFRTRDLGQLRHDGWLTVIGRADDVIIRGGENVSPSEVEAVCATLDGVRQAVVVGFPDERLGQRLALVVAGAVPDVARVRAHCEAAGLAAFKTPEHIVAVDEIPVLPAGKPDRAALGAHVARVVSAGSATAGGSGTGAGAR